MSASMWIWRVALPGFGLLLSGLVLWQSRQVGDRSTPGASNGVSTGLVTPARSPARERIVAEGRVVARPGAEVVVAAEDGGTVVKVAVREKSRVRKGDLLVTLRSGEQEATVAEARARLAAAEAELAFQGREFKRRIGSDVSSKLYSAELDSARRDLDLAKAHRDAAAAALRRYELALDRTRVRAPIEGVVLAIWAHAGETLPPAARLVEIADLKRTFVHAEVDEFDAGRVVPGAEVTILAEGRAGQNWRGRIEDVPDRVVERELRPEDPGRPSDARVLRVRVAPDGPIPLKLGQRVEVEIRGRRVR
jgi:RND family efflux transporter MFP subunit